MFSDWLCGHDSHSQRHLSQHLDGLNVYLPKQHTLYDTYITVHTHLTLCQSLPSKFSLSVPSKGGKPAEAPKGGPCDSYIPGVINVFLMALLLTFPSSHYGSTGTIFIASATLWSAFSPSTMGSVEGQELEAQLYTVCGKAFCTQWTI